MIEYIDPRAEPQKTDRFGVGWFFADLGWMLLYAFAVALFTFAVGAAITPAMGSIGFMFALLVIVALSVRARNIRRARALAAMNYLEQAARLNLPLPPMLAAAEASEGFAMRRRLERLRAEIEGGSPVASALNRALPGAPPRVLGLVAAGERLGRLPQALNRAVAAERVVTTDRRRAMQAIMLRWYPLLMAVAIGPIFFIIMIFVMPKFEAIFRDFGLKLPAATLWMISLWDWLQWPLTVLAVAGVIFACARMFADLIPGGRARLGPFRTTHRLAWHVPPWRGVTRSRGLADACSVVADALPAGQPADRALSDASDACGNLVLRNTFLRWSGYVSEGMPLADAAKRAGLPALVVGMLRPARDTAGVADVFAFLTRYYDSRYSTAAALLEGAAIPVMVAIMAFFVLTLALGLFMPLVELINHLPGGKGVM